MRLLPLAAFVSAVSAAEIALHHRVFHPDLPAQRYLPRATVDLESATLVPAPSLAEDLASFSEALQSLPDNSEALYQVALEHEGDSSEAFWDYCSVKTCYLSKATSDTILLHLSGDEEPFAIDYFVSPIPHDGSCPPLKSKSKTRSPASSLKTFANKAQRLNSTVLIRRPTTPPLPELRAPPALTPEGEVVKPPVEKSFVQKYWMYIVAFLLIILVGAGPEDPPEQPKKTAGGGQ